LGVWEWEFKHPDGVRDSVSYHVVPGWYTLG